MHEPAKDDLEPSLFDPELSVLVRLQYRAKAGKPTHRFKYEQKRLRAIEASYLRELRAWELPPTRAALETLEWLWKQPAAVIYVKDDWETVSADDL